MEEAKRHEAARLAEALSLVVSRTRARMYSTPPLKIPTGHDARMKVLWVEVRARVLAYLTQQAHDGDPETARDAQQVWTTFETCWKFMSLAEIPAGSKSSPGRT